MEYISLSQEETQKLAYDMGLKAKAGDILCLLGDLGVGKTVFTKGFANGLAVEDCITSPTFTIVNEYKGRLPLYHFDVYRIGNWEQMEDTGYEEYFFSNGVSLVEWADIIEELIPTYATWVIIEKDYEKGENYRKIKVVLGKSLEKGAGV